MIAINPDCFRKSESGIHENMRFVRFSSFAKSGGYGWRIYNLIFMPTTISTSGKDDAIVFRREPLLRSRQWLC